MPPMPLIHGLLGRMRTLTICLTLGIGLTWLSFRFYKDWQEWKLERKLRTVGRVRKLYIYPIKGCRGIRVHTAECTMDGMKHHLIKDRVFLLIDKNGNFISGIQEPLMILIQPTFHDNEMWVDAPDIQTLKINLYELSSRALSLHRCRIWDDEIEGFDCGDDAAEWFRTYLRRRDVRLVYHRSDLPPRLCRNKGLFDSASLKSNSGVFHDVSPYSLMAKASVDEINEKLQKPISMRRFRPNIVIEGSAPYDEDRWTHVRIGQLVWFCFIQPIQRNKMISISPVTGELDNEEDVVAILKKCRRITDARWKNINEPLLGINLGLKNEGVISVGDWVYAVH